MTFCSDVKLRYDEETKRQQKLRYLYNFFNLVENIWNEIINKKFLLQQTKKVKICTQTNMNEIIFEFFLFVFLSFNIIFFTNSLVLVFLLLFLYCSHFQCISYCMWLKRFQCSHDKTQKMGGKKIVPIFFFISFSMCKILEKGFVLSIHIKRCFVHISVKVFILVVKCISFSSVCCCCSYEQYAWLFVPGVVDTKMWIAIPI